MTDESKNWKPTENIIRGVVIRPYLPLKRHPELKDQHTNILNLYAGDEVFVFEVSKDGKWLRCYLRWIPLPESYVSGTPLIDDQLVHLRNRLVVVPKKFVHLELERAIVDMPFLKMPNLSDFRPALSSACKTPSIFEALLSGIEPGSALIEASSKPLRPSFPYFRYQDRPLSDELSVALVLLSSVIYGVYSSGDFNLFDQLVSLFYDLEAIRMKLQSQLCTSHEVVKISRNASALLANVSKLISSKNKSGFVLPTLDRRISDHTGIEGIFARNVNTGELLAYEDDSLQSLVYNTMLHGLSKNFPVSNCNYLLTDFSSNGSLEAAISHILVDVNDVTSDASLGNPKLQNLSASMYLCSKRKILTEPFTVNMDSDEITSLNNISAALFKNIPASKIERGNIYLAVTLTEKIPLIVDKKSSDHQSNSSSPFIPFTDKEAENISYVRRGVAVGAVDITRVFSKYNESNADLSEAFKIKISLFGSFLSKDDDNTKAGLEILHNKGAGWGDLIERILLNSPKGVAVNPRATSLLVTIKEIKSFGVNKAAEAAIGAIKSVPTFFYDTFSEVTDCSERIYLSLGKVSLSSNIQTNIRAVTIKVSCSNSQIKFNRIADEDLRRSWEFITVRPGESIGEVIRISGLKFMRAEETILVSAFLNGVPMAKLQVTVKKGHEIVIYKKFTTFQLLNITGEPLLNLELSTQYVGVKYNMESVIDKFQKLPFKTFDKMTDTNVYYMDVLIGMTKQSVDQLQKYTRNILLTFLRCMEIIEFEDTDLFTDEVRRQIFVSFVDFIDKLTARDERLKYSLDMFYHDYLISAEELPNVGPVILQHMTAIIGKSSREWGVLGSAVSRTSLYLIMISLVTGRKNVKEWRRSYESFFSEVCQFLAGTSDLVAKDQIIILETYDTWLEVVSRMYEPEMLVQFSLGLLQNCRSKEEIMNFSSKKLSLMESQYLNTKLSLLRRIIIHKNLLDYLYDAENNRMIKFAFLSKCIDWTLTTYTFTHLSISAARLANGVLISLIENANDRKICRNLLRLVPTLCKAFLLTRRHCRDNNYFKPKITFTELFPPQRSSRVLPMDSLIQSDIIVEVLLELITVICDLAKMAERIYGSSLSLEDIFVECRSDSDFQTEFCSKRSSNNHIINLCHIIKIIAKGEFFPAQKWLGVSAMLDRSMTTLLSMYKDYMIRENIPEDPKDVNIKLWTNYFKAILTVSNSKQAYLVKLGIIPRKGVFRITGDLKLRSAALLASSWNALAGQVYDSESEVNFGLGTVSPVQIQIIRENAKILQEIYLFCFHRHLEALIVGSRIFLCLATTMWKEYKNIELFRDLSIPDLYDAYQSGRLFMTDHDLQRFKLCSLLMAHAPPPAFNEMFSAMEDCFAFLHTACNACKISSEEEFDEDRTAVHMEMFTQLLNVNLPELFHRMIYDLYVHFLSRRDNVQAGLCLELLANTYEWNMNDDLPSLEFPPLPEQSSFARKEHLYKEAARHFSIGLKFEKALSIYRDLIAAYDLINYDLTGLAYVHGKMANIYNELQTVDRLIPTFFKVSFTGLGFPTSIRNKTFIFEGLPFEHITSMHERLLRVYHGTTILRSQTEMDEHFANPSMGRFIHVVSVEPQFDISEHYKKSAENKHFLNSKVWIYIKNRELRTFSNSQRLPGSTSVTDLWVDEVTYKTAATFPTLMNRSEVIETKIRRLSPFQTAMRSLRVKIQEFNGLENMCWKAIKGRDDSSDAFNELSRNLAGTIDSPVNGGFAKYRAFLSPELQPPLSKEDANSLQVAFSDLAIVLARCLILHYELLPSGDLKQTHNMLLDLFKRNFEPEIKKSKINLEGISTVSITSSSSLQQTPPLHLTRTQTIQILLDNVCKSDRHHTESVRTQPAAPARTDTTESDGTSINQSKSELLQTSKDKKGFAPTNGAGNQAPYNAPVKWALIGLDDKDNL